MYHSEKEARFKFCYHNIYLTKKYVVRQEIYVMHHDYEEVFCSLDHYMKRTPQLDSYYDDIFFENTKLPNKRRKVEYSERYK